MSKLPTSNLQPIDALFPVGSRVLLTGTGRQFVERLGVEATRQAVLNIMLGQNVRAQTEKLTRQKIAQVSGAMVVLFAKGLREIPDFQSRLPDLAMQQIAASKKNDNASIWPAQWLIGLTGKAVQNVLRNDPALIQDYAQDFQAAIEEAALKCQADLGDLKMILGFVEDKSGLPVELDWRYTDAGHHYWQSDLNDSRFR